MIFCVYGDAILPGDDTGFGWSGPPKGGGQAHSVEVTASTLYEVVAVPWRAGVVGGEEGWVAAGGVSAGEDTGDIGDGR